jgi:xylulokinase
MLLTIDIGTSNFKSALWDYGGNRLSFAARPISIISNNDEKHEAECSQILQVFEQCCRELKDVSAVEAIVISGNGPSLIPVLGEPALEKARLWMDKRAAKYSEEVSEVMGGFVAPCFFLPKIVYVKNEEQELYKKTKFFLGVPEYLAFSLTGNARNVFPSDGFERWFWNDAVLEKLSLDKAKLPQFIRPGEAFGTLSPSAAGKFGLAKEIPVISGGPDFFSAILGSGVLKPGQACDRAGSSEGINACTEKRIGHAKLMSYGHPVKPYWNLSGVINTSGIAIDWCRSLLQISDFNEFVNLAAKSKRGSGGLFFHPCLAGERNSLSGASSGGVWSGLNLSSGREELANSVLEGICYAVREIIMSMEEAGAKIGQLHVTGRLASSAYLNQMKADITGKEVVQGVYKESELLGLAIIGSCFMNKYNNYADAAGELVRTEKTYKPNQENLEVYHETSFHVRL